MRILLSIVLVFLGFISGAQTVNQAASLTNLLSQKPVRGGLYQVLGHSAPGDWGAIRVGIHVSDSTAITNLHSIFQFGTNTAGGRLFLTDTNGVVDAAWVKPAADGTTDDLIKLQSVANLAKLSPARTLRIPAGTYKVLGTLDVSGLRLLADNATLVPDGTNYALQAVGSLGTYRALSASVVRGASTITSAALAAEVTNGTFIKIISTNLFSTDAARPQGEIAIVSSVSGSDIELQGPLFDSYSTNHEAQAAVVTMTRFDDGGLSVHAPEYHATNAPTPQGAFIQYASRPIITGRYQNCSEAGVRIFDCWSPQVLNAHIESSFRAGVGNGDALFIGNATMHASVIGGTFTANRAGIDLGGNSQGGVVWDLKVYGIAASNHPDSTQNALVEHSSVGSVVWESCTVTGSGSSQRGIGPAGRYSTIRNLRAVGVPYAVYSTDSYGTILGLDIDGITMESPVAQGNVVTLDTTVRDLKMRAITGDFGGGNALLLGASSIVGAWEFDRLRTTNGTGVLILNGASVPSRLEVSDSSFATPSQSTTVYGVRILDPDVTEVVLRNVSQDKLAGLLYCDALATGMRLHLVGVNSTSPNESHILSDAALDSVFILGSTFGNPANAAYVISASSIDLLSLDGTVTSGANLSKFASGNVTLALDLGNDLHITLPGAWANGTVTEYTLPLRSDGALPFALTIDTTSADNLTSVRAITSGKARLYVGGRNTTTTGYTFGGGGGDFTLQNLDTTAGNFTQIANLDAAGGSFNAGIVFLNESHTADHGSIRFYSRAGGGQPVEAGYWSTNGVLVPAYGVSLSGTNRTTWPTGIADIYDLQNQLDLRQLTNAHLTSISAISSNGILARTASGTVATRHLVGDSEIVVVSADGSTNNPTLSIGSSIMRDSEAASGYQPLNPYLTELSGMTGLAGTILYFDGSTLTSLGIGSVGQVLIATNSPNRPFWGGVAPGGGSDGFTLQAGSTIHGVTNLSITTISPISKSLTGGASNALLSLELAGSPVYVNDSAAGSYELPLNLNSTTPAAPTETVLARPQVSGTNASFVVDISPTIGRIDSMVVVSNTAAWTTIASGRLNVTNLPYNGAILSGKYWGTVYNNSATTVGLGVRLQISGASVFEDATPTSVLTINAADRSFSVGFDIARLATNSIASMGSLLISALLNPPVGQAGGFSAAATVPPREMVGVYSTADITTNATWNFDVQLSAASTNASLYVNGGGVK